MGCFSSRGKEDSSTWTNIHHAQTPVRPFTSTRNGELERKLNFLSGIKGKRGNTYFEPCLLYVNEPGHEFYHLNDLGLYERDISFVQKVKKSTQLRKRPKCTGKWIDSSFDESKFRSVQKEFTLLRPQEIESNTCYLFDLNDEKDCSNNGSSNFVTNALMLATDSYLLQRVLPDDTAKVQKYDGIFHCRFCRFGIWEDVYIDDRLPVGPDGAVIGSVEKQTWVPLLEKAYAKFLGDYDVIRNHRFLEVFRTLTGGTGEVIKFTDKRNDPNHTKFCNRLDAALKNGSWVVCNVSKNRDGIFNLHGNQVFIVIGTLKVQTKQTKNVVLVRLWNPVGLAEWSGQWSEKSIDWDTVTSGCKPSHLEDGEFYMSVECLIKYMESLTICNLIPEQNKLDTEQRSNYITKIYGEWKGQTAAGLKYLHNPKYLINVSDKGTEKDDKVRLVVILEQLTSNNSTDLVAIKIKLYFVRTECEEGVIVEDVDEEGICSKRMSVTLSYRVLPGKYLVVPHTDREDLEKEFMIAVYTPTPISDVRLLGNQKPVLVSKQDNTAKLRGFETNLGHLEYAWGRWSLRRGQIHGEEFYKNPQFEITVPDEGSTCWVQFHLLKDCFQEEACIGFRLFKMTSRKEMPLSKGWIDAIWDDPVKCHDGSIEGWHWNCISPTYFLKSGTYVAIAWADKPEYKCSFCLVVRVSTDINIKSYNCGTSVNTLDKRKDK